MEDDRDEQIGLENEPMDEMEAVAGNISDDDLPEELKGDEAQPPEPEQEPGEAPEEAPEQVQTPHQPGIVTGKRLRDASHRRTKNRKGLARPKVSRIDTPKTQSDSRADYRKSRGGSDIKPLPLPPTAHFRDENAQRIYKPERFWDYWRSLMQNPDVAQRVVVYVYRNWPVMIEKKCQVEKCYEYVPLEDLARRWGAGDYNLKLNDMGGKYAMICQCTIKNVGNRNLSEYPPVLNIENLVTTDPLNTTYIAWCRSRGIPVPGDPAFEERKQREEEEEMAEQNQFREMMSEVRRSHAQIVELQEQRIREAQSKQEEDAPPVTQDAAALGVIEGMKVIAEASKLGQSIVNTAVTQALNLQSQNNDPLGAITQVAGVLEKIKGPQEGSSDRMTKMFDKMLEMQEKRIEAMQTEIALLRERANNPVVGTPVAPRTMEEQVESLVKMRTGLRKALGLGEHEEDEEKSGWTQYIPQILQGVTLLGTVIASGLNNLAVARTGIGVPTPVPPPDHILTPEQMAAAQRGQMGYAPGAVGNPPQPQQTPQGAQPPMTPTQRFNAFLTMIKIPLLKSLEDGESGLQFAEKLVVLADNGLFGPNNPGDEVYDMVVEYPQAVVSHLIQTHPDFGPVVNSNPAKWARFMSEFYGARAIWDAQDQDAPDTSTPPAA